MIRRQSISVAAITAATLLAGCASEIGERTVGASIDEGGFGNPTLNNHLVMSGERGYVVDLNRRFAAEVPSMVTFPFDSASITPEAAAALREQAAFMRQFPELHFSVYGHTDLVGSDAYNERLGRRRAQAVVAYLASLGVSPSRLEALVSFGEQRPLVPVPGPERRNRRTVTEVSGFVRSHPMVLDGKYAQIVYRGYVQSATPAPQVGAPAGTYEQ